MVQAPDALREAVLREVFNGLIGEPGEQKTLSPWLFYDDHGSQLFERITALPEYYLTRTERAILAAHAGEILDAASGGARLTLLELGAGTAAKTGLLLEAAVARQGSVLYQPIDVSGSALDEACASISAHIPGVITRPQVANYTTDPFTLSRLPGERALALYIGSSIGNFAPSEATAILRNLREHLQPGDTLLLGADLAPAEPALEGQKSVAQLLAAYDDAAGVTAEFNKNVLTRLNRDLNANFNTTRFTHRARWNAAHSRMEMHLESTVQQMVSIAGERIVFAAGETIHTENSYKFNDRALATLLASASFAPAHIWHDPARFFAVSMARAV